MRTRDAGIVFDLPLGSKSPSEESTNLFSRNQRIRDAVDHAETMSDNRMISQDVARELEEELPVEDRYAFHMALVDADIRVRTGACVVQKIVKRTAAVNVVDREEPVVRELGDAAVNSTNLWTADPAMPRDELNTDPDATTELDAGKPRRSEGGKHEGGGFGNSLTDLTMLASLSVEKVAQGYGEGAFAVSREQVIAMLNRALGLEYSQALRYRIYADTLRLAYRDALAGEFEDHADEETEHAQALSAKIVALGGALDPKIEEPVRIPPNDPDLVGRVLRELWKQEQEGIKFYRELKRALGEHIFVHYIEEVLTAESEHVDDLVRFTQVTKSAAVVPLPSYPARSEPARWADSYTSENQFEGTDKMGVAELGKCPHCESGEVLGNVCEKCSGKTASVVRALCDRCDGFGFVKECVVCGEAWSPPPLLSVAKIATWQLRTAAVKRRTMYGEIPVWIEHDPGDTKRGKSRTGEAWERKMQASYGFIPGTRGADGEPMDVYLGGNPSRSVYVVSQLVPGAGFDEEKVMLGFPNAQQAEAMYRAHMPNNGVKHFGGMREMSVGEFEDEYLRSDRANPYKPMLQLRQFHVTGQNKMVPNPNPEGREDLVTEEYAEKWKAEHGQGEPAEQAEGLSEVFQKAKQDKAKSKVQQAVKALDGAKTGDFVRGLSDKLGITRQRAMQVTQQLEASGVIRKEVTVPDEKSIDPKTKEPAKREVVRVDSAKLKQVPSVAPEPAPAATEPAQEAPAVEEPKQSPSESAEVPAAPAERQPAAPIPAAQPTPVKPKKQKTTYSDDEPLGKAEHPWPVDEKSIPAPPLTRGEYKAVHSFLRPEAAGKKPLTKFTVDDFASGTGLPKDKAEKLLATLVAGDEYFERGTLTKNKDGTFSPYKEEKPLSLTDTSKAVSPITQQDMRDQGKAKELEMQFWRLLGGPGFNPYKTSVRDLHRLARRVIAESYSQPDHGPLGTDGEPDHPVEDQVVQHASTENWSFSVSGAVLLERVAKGDLVKVQGPTGWVGLVSKGTMAKNPGKYVPVKEQPEGQPASPEGGSRPKKSEGLAEPMTASRVLEQAFVGPRNWSDSPPPGIPEETWMAHFDAHPWYGKCSNGHQLREVAAACPQCGRAVLPASPKPERAKLHEAIIAEFLDRVSPVAPGEQKLAILTMGGPASGKSTMLGSVDTRNFVTVDPDKIKERLPEYQESIKPDLTWRNAAKCAHKESTFIGDELQRRAMEEGKHLVVDGTGADFDSFAANIRKLKAAGYKVRLYMPDIDLDEALARMKRREELEGRYVPEDIVRNAYERVPLNFHPLAELVDDAFLFDARRPIPSADGKKRPRLVWAREEGVEKRHDPRFMARFQQRATELSNRRRPVASQHLVLSEWRS